MILGVSGSILAYQPQGQLWISTAGPFTCNHTRYSHNVRSWHLSNQNLSIHFTLVYFKKKTDSSPRNHTHKYKSKSLWHLNLKNGSVVWRIGSQPSWKSAGHQLESGLCRLLLLSAGSKGRGRNGVRAGRYKLQRGEVTNSYNSPGSFFPQVTFANSIRLRSKNDTISCYFGTYAGRMMFFKTGGVINSWFLVKFERSWIYFCPKWMIQTQKKSPTGTPLLRHRNLWKHLIIWGNQSKKLTKKKHDRKSKLHDFGIGEAIGFWWKKGISLSPGWELLMCFSTIVRFMSCIIQPSTGPTSSLYRYIYIYTYKYRYNFHKFQFRGYPWLSHVVFINPLLLVPCQKWVLLSTNGIDADK